LRWHEGCHVPNDYVRCTSRHQYVLLSWDWISLFFAVYLRNTWPSVVRVFRSLIVRHRLIFVFLLHLIDVPFIQFTEFTSLEMFGRSYSTIAKIIRGELWNIVVLLVRFCIVGCCASLYNHSDKMSANYMISKGWSNII
jgi:hypothetical protein